MDPRGLRLTRAMIFAIEEINKSTELLPGVKLGYQIYDSCASVPVAMHAAIQLLNGNDSVFNSGDNCSHSGVVMAVVGEFGSTASMSISRVTGPFNIPLVNNENFSKMKYSASLIIFIGFIVFFIFLFYFLLLGESLLHVCLPFR